MTYQVTARKWRPLVFDDVIGQSHVTNTLRNAIAANRVAHAYLFSGTRGCGKTTTARILARALNCLSPDNQNPDNVCEICKEIIDSRSMDVIEIDGASNRGVEEIRNLRDSVRYTPTRGKYKIYIIDEVHMLTKEAFNALLKTLEEPPPHIVFVFATTEVHKVPMTILSRCQRFDFLRISVNEIIKSLSSIALAENVVIEEDALMIIAKRADGSLRDAQSIFDQTRSFCGNEIKAVELLKAFNVVDQEVYFQFSDLLKSRNTSEAAQLVDEIIKNGYDLREFIMGLSEHLRNLLITSATQSTDLIDATEYYKKKYKDESANFNEQDLLRYIKISNELEQAVRWASQPRYRLEAGLIQMVKMESSVLISELLRQIETLKKKLDGNNKTSQNITPPSIDSSRRENNLSSEIKIVGEVGAGYLKSKSAISYTSLIGTDLSKINGLPKPVERNPHISEKSAAIITASSDDVSEKWIDFVDRISKSHIAIGASLTQSKLLDVHNGVVRLVCEDNYHFSMIKRNKELLTDSLNQIIGKQAVIEPILNSSANIPVKPVYSTISHQNTKATEHTQQNTDEPAENHLFAILKSELGLERIA